MACAIYAYTDTALHLHKEGKERERECKIQVTSGAKLVHNTEPEQQA